MPIDQGMAITGAIDQLGHLEAIGGVNEQVEGFYDACHYFGLTGDQGVVIPKPNAGELMLREDLMEQARSGQFSVYPVSKVDEAIELLTGMQDGEENEHGLFPEGTFNQRVQARLAQLADIHQNFNTPEHRK